MAMGLAYFLIGVGLLLILAGLSVSGISTPPEIWIALTGGTGLIGFSAWLRKLGHDWLWEARARRSCRRDVSPLAESLTPQLYGSYTPYIMDAAQELAAARDTTAVPALLIALENCVNTQYPGWREVAETLANALAQIGDRRALPLLTRLENVRGIGLIPAIRHAIAAIEPKSSLLRPGSAEMLPGTLLRPASDVALDRNATLLLRAGNSKPGL